MEGFDITRLFITACLLTSLSDLSAATTFNLNGSFGEFHSTSYPNPYGNFLDDTWVIKVKPGFRAVIYFTDFELEDSFNIAPCPQDYVEVIDGFQTNSSIRLCGNPRLFKDDAPALYSQKFRSSGNQLTVRMRSDYSNDLPGSDEPLTGFRAHFFSEDRNECAELNKAAALSDTPERVGKCEHYCNNYPGGYYCSCRKGYRLNGDGYSCVGDCGNVVLTEESGVVKTPGYPQNYPRLTECNWKISTAAGKKLEMEFLPNFHIEDHPSSTCPYDYVQIFDSSGDIGTFCGSVVPFPGNSLRSTTNWFKVRFHSDSFVEYAGFQINYRTHDITCRLPNPPSHGTLSYINTDGRDVQVPSDVIPFSALIRFHCDQGFRLIGAGKIACLKDGSLSDDPPICEPF